MKRGVITVSMLYLHLPEGTKVVGAAPSADGEMVDIVIEHETVPEIPDAAPLPVLEPAFQRNSAGRIYMTDWGYDPRRSWEPPGEEPKPKGRKRKG